jgi:hypothetical protein
LIFWTGNCGYFGVITGLPGGFGKKSRHFSSKNRETLLNKENLIFCEQLFKIRDVYEPCYRKTSNRTHGALIFNPKILKIFTLVSPDVSLKKRGLYLLEGKGALLEVLRYMNLK